MHEKQLDIEIIDRLEPYKTWLNDFVSTFLGGSEKDSASIILKKEHSFRVLENARQIAGSLDLNADESLVVEVAALLHDVGRFPQYAKYKTFVDGISINHGYLGTKTLAGRNLLKNLGGRGRKTVLGAVFLHNKPRIPIGLPRHIDQTARIVRDADKLDIMGVLWDHVRPGGSRNETVTLALEDDPARYTPIVIERVRNGESISYDSLVYINDFLIAAHGWIHDLNFRESFRELRRRAYIDALYSLLPHDAELNRLHEEISSYLLQKAE